MKNLIFITTIAFTTIALASGGETGHDEHGAIPLREIGWQAANLGILLIAMFFLIKKAIKDAFLNRKKHFVEQSEKTKNALLNAEMALSGVKTKLNNLESGEKTSIEKAAHEAAAVKANLIKEAESQALKLKEESKMLIHAELEKAKSEIGTMIMSGAISATTRKLNDKKAQVTKDSESEFLRQVGQVKA